MFEQLFFNLGIPTYMQSIYVTITNTRTINFPKQMPNQIGWIYGISTYCDGVTPDNQTLPTTAQAEDLYTVWKAGQTEFIAAYRVSQLSFFNANGTDQQYQPVNIPSKISLDQSQIINPTGASGFTLMLNLFYIDEASYLNLIKSGRLGTNGLFQQVAR